MNVSHELDMQTEEAVVRVLRAARAADAAALPTRHAQRTDACMPISRAFAVARLGSALSAAEQQHFNGCAFCQSTLRSFFPSAGAVADDDTTITGEETTHFETKPKTKPPGGAAPGATT